MAVPPAESPSTKKTSHLAGSCSEQSESIHSVSKPGFHETIHKTDGKTEELHSRVQTSTDETIRLKEEEPDYRYFQDPDLPQITVSNERISAMYGILGEVPFEVKRRFTN